MAYPQRGFHEQANLPDLSDLTDIRCNFYHPPTKLWEGNVFFQLCVSVCLSHVTITYSALDLQGPPLYRNSRSWPPGHIQTYST